MIGRDPVRTRLPLRNHTFGESTLCERCTIFDCYTYSTSHSLWSLFSPLHPFNHAQKMGLGIVEPRRQGTQVPATALLLQDDLTGTTGKKKDDIVLVPRPSNTPRDPLVLSPLHHMVNFITYLLDRIGHCGRKISVSLPYASQSPSVVYRVPYWKQSMGFSYWISRLRSQKLKICRLTHHSHAPSHVSLHPSWLA